MNSETLKLIGLFIICYFILTYVFHLYNTLDVRYLNYLGWVYYYSPNCPYCIEQKNQLGASYDVVNKVDCTKKPELCSEKNIQGYPSWVNESTKQVHSGLINIENGESLYNTLSKS